MDQYSKPKHGILVKIYYFIFRHLGVELYKMCCVNSVQQVAVLCYIIHSHREISF